MRLRTLLCIGFALASIATSQPPSPSAGEREGAPQDEQARPTQQDATPLVGTQANPAIVRLDQSQEQASQEQADRESQASSEWWTVALTSALVAFTFLLVVVGALQWNVYRATLRTNQTIERAYVAVRHWNNDEARTEQIKDVGFHPRANLADAAPAGCVRYKVELRIANTGRSPAHIEGGAMRVVADLDTAAMRPPDLTAASWREKIPGNYLHAGDRYRRKVYYVLGGDDAALVNTGRMWLVGYVDYIDVFGERHRAGYCRHIKPGLADNRNNLDVDSTSVSFNYDRVQRKRGQQEG